MNFWEARQAALEGKKVRCVGENNTIRYSAYFQFADYFSNLEIEGDWEIVEEPKYRTYYINIYPHSIGGPADSIDTANRRAGQDGMPTRKGCIELVTDESGKLISARNV